MLIGELTVEQLRFLIDELEEEGPDDRGYYLDWGTLDLLQDAGADRELQQLLRRCLERRAAASPHPFREAAAAEAQQVEGVEILWESDEDLGLP
jgi:hypothetical protein